MALQTETEKRQIRDMFDDLISSHSRPLSEENLAFIEKAFHFANDAHMGVKRKDGDPYILHPLAVAKIVSTEIGLGTKAIVSAILHDVVEDTDYTLEDISALFGEKISSIVNGLTKISETLDAEKKQAENFRKMLLTLSDDVRVILIKLADRLHNMRTMESMPPHKQMRISAETLFIFSPLAHRLGLYSIKTELEDLSLKYKNPEQYKEISYRLHDQREKYDQLITQICEPIRTKLAKQDYEFVINGRPKSIYSIWNKMQTKNVTFDQIFDILAIRIIFKPKEIQGKTVREIEKMQCFEILAQVTDVYKPKADRIRDWISTPKANGYEALHVTVMGPEGKFVEVQIRSERMNEIAERGYAAHYRYKGGSEKEADNTNELDIWLKKVKDHLQNSESDALDFLDQFRLNLFSHEIYVFTPNGEMKVMPKNSTVLDFAYEIHTQLGNRCIGAKVNQNLVNRSEVLQSGDQIEILTSDNQSPQPAWMNIAITARAQEKIRNTLKQSAKKHIEDGQQIVERELHNLDFKPTANTLRKIIRHYHLSSKEQLYSQVGMGLLSLDELKEILARKSENKLIKIWRLNFLRRNQEEEEEPLLIDKKKPVVINEEGTDYRMSKCCDPIPGDDVVGFVTDNYVMIHKKECPNALQRMAENGNDIVLAEWAKFKVLSSLVKIEVKGFDRVGIIMDISQLISKQNNTNMRSVTFDAREGIFEGTMYLYIQNLGDLNKLLSQLKSIKGIDSARRVEE